MLLATAYDWLSIDALMRYKWMKVNEYHFEWVHIVAIDIQPMSAGWRCWAAVQVHGKI